MINAETFKIAERMAKARTITQFQAVCEKTCVGNPKNKHYAGKVKTNLIHSCGECGGYSP